MLSLNLIMMISYPTHVGMKTVYLLGTFSRPIWTTNLKRIMLASFEVQTIAVVITL